MKIIWQIDKQDIAKVKKFVGQHEDDPFVKNRRARNLGKETPAITRNYFWEVMIGCLLTTQQRSGPKSFVAQFMRMRPFLLRFEQCQKQTPLGSFVTDVLTKFGGIRRSTIIGQQAQANFSYFENGGWKDTRELLETVRLEPSPTTEREAAQFVDDHFKGFGPKQSRNLLQWLGLSQFEIPIDSRITKWLNKFGFPVILTADALSDRNYYEFISDGFQKLCEACEISPCILDAVIFTSFDKGQWKEGFAG